MDPINILIDKYIVLGVTGSIAVYKAVDLASKLTQAGAIVDVIMTDAAQRFVSPLTFQSVTGRPVYTDMWGASGDSALPTHVAHVGLGEQADLLVIAPATANTIARLAHGMADNLLCVTALTADCLTMIAPAMDGHMYLHPAVQYNLQTLTARGVEVIPPEQGRFASGLLGTGRLPETATLLGHIRRGIAQHGDLDGQKVIISAGGTRETIDPVRYLTNRSSGKQGHALAQAAVDAGAQQVILITTMQSLTVPIGAEAVYVDSAQSMCDAVIEYSADADLLIMAAAVADFRPETVAEHKIKKSGDDLHLTLTRTPDILLNVKAQREETGYPRIVVGFAAESEDLLLNAQAKLERKGVDFLVANDISAVDAGFGTDTNRVIILDSDGGQYPLELASKAQISESIIAHAARLLKA